VAGLLLTGAVVAAPATTASAAAPDTWTAFAGDAGNAATNPGETVITTVTAARVGTAWATTSRSASPYAPAVVDGAALRVVSTGNVYDPSQLTSTSPTTGATLGTVQLPGGAQYYSGLTVTGSLALIPFHGFQRPGGVLAVDLSTRKVVWSRDLPASALSWSGNSQAGLPYTDGQRVYVSGSSNVVNAYRLSDGALLWTAPITFNSQNTPNRVDGMAVGNGAVFTAGAEGLVAYDAATGRRLWTGPGSGRPVVAGGRVFVTGSGVVQALPAAGCGKATCAPSWTTPFPVLNPNTLEVAGADASTLFVTYSDGTGVVTRLSASTGARQWSATVGRYATGLVRGGDMVWLNNEYADASGAVAQRIVGFSATATGSVPLRTIPLTADLAGFPQTLGVAAGTLFQQVNGRALVGYRVAPTTPVNAAPTASFSTSVNGLSVLADGSGSRDPDGQVKTYSWDFGNGVTGWGNPTATTYASPGTYRITLTVTDWAGAAATTSRSVTVSASSAAFAVDSFRRTVTGGLGTADLGGPWTVLNGAARQSVSGGTATLSLAPGATVGSYLGGTTRPSADVTASVSLNAVPDGGGVSYYLIGRRVAANREYRLKVRFAADGTVRLTPLVLDSSATERSVGATTTATGLRYTPGTPVHVRFQVAGSGTTRLLAKAWTGSAEPPGWAVSRTDATASVQGPGQVGMTSYLSSSATMRSLALSVTEFRARPVG
jgi:outer membrane protein assembly factor BamB